MTLQKSTFLLKLASAITAGSGIAMILSLFTPLGAVMVVFLDLAYLPVDGAQYAASDEGRLLTAISGGVLTGWGVMCWLVTAHLYARDPATGGRILAISVSTWFVADGLGSVIAGAWFNVVMNSVFLALFLVPIVMAQRGLRAHPA